MFRTIALMIMAVLAASPAVAATAAPEADQIFGQWRASADATSVLAYTQNESGAQFGFGCSDGRCFYYLYTRAGCVVDRQYDLLLSSQTAGDAPQIHSAFPRAVCGAGEGDDADLRALYFDGQNMPAVIAASVVAIAIPAEDSQFRVSKFSLEGASAAVTWARARYGQAPASGDAPQ